MFGTENLPLPACARLPYAARTAGKPAAGPERPEKRASTPKKGRNWEAGRSRMAQLLDIVVVGGGITDPGIARDAAGPRPPVLLCEKSDLASGPSQLGQRSCRDRG